MIEHIEDTEKGLKDWFWSELDHQRIIWDGVIASFKSERPDIDFADLENIVANLKEETLKLEKKLGHI